MQMKKLRKHHVSRKDYIWNLSAYTSENIKYLESIIDDAVVTCDEIIEVTKSIPTNLKEKMVTREIENF